MTIPFCPDHRDKVSGMSCRQCAVEYLMKSINIAIDKLDHEMARNEITELRELLIRKRADVVGAEPVPSLYNPSLSVDVVAAYYTTQGIIPAIKMWREISGKGLKECKEDVERASRERGWTNYFVGKICEIAQHNDEYYAEKVEVLSVNMADTPPSCKLKLINCPDQPEIDRKLHQIWKPRK
jgi:ribosomal protein L7/L12